jgi:hypothetical protein
MMHRSILLIAILSAPGSRALAVDAAAEARKQIQAAYNRENAAAARKDTSGVIANMTPDYRNTDLRGQTATVDQIRQSLPRLFASAISLKARSVVNKITLKGDQADTVVNEHAELMLFNARTRKPSRLVIDEVYQTLWVKTGGGWRKKRSKVLSSTQKLDGKRVRQPK